MYIIYYILEKIQSKWSQTDEKCFHIVELYCESIKKMNESIYFYIWILRNHSSCVH